MLAVLEAKSTIYCLDKGQVIRKSSELCSKYFKMYENDFINMLNNKSDNTDSMGKFAMYCKVKKMYVRKILAFNWK